MHVRNPSDILGSQRRGFRILRFCLLNELLHIYWPLTWRPATIFACYQVQISNTFTETCASSSSSDSFLSSLPFVSPLRSKPSTKSSQTSNISVDSLILFSCDLKLGAGQDFTNFILVCFHKIKKEFTDSDVTVFKPLSFVTQNKLVQSYNEKMNNSKWVKKWDVDAPVTLGGHPNMVMKCAPFSETQQGSYQFEIP